MQESLCTRNSRRNPSPQSGISKEAARRTLAWTRDVARASPLAIHATKEGATFFSGTLSRVTQEGTFDKWSSKTRRRNGRVIRWQLVCQPYEGIDGERTFCNCSKTRRINGSGNWFANLIKECPPAHSPRQQQPRTRDSVHCRRPRWKQSPDRVCLWLARLWTTRSQTASLTALCSSSLVFDQFLLHRGGANTRATAQGNRIFLYLARTPMSRGGDAQRTEEFIRLSHMRMEWRRMDTIWSTAEEASRSP